MFISVRVAKDPRRLFTREERTVIYRQANGRCVRCGKEISFQEMHADHIAPFYANGKTMLDNAQGLCGECHNQNGARTASVAQDA